MMRINYGRPRHESCKSEILMMMALLLGLTLSQTVLLLLCRVLSLILTPDTFANDGQCIPVDYSWCNSFNYDCYYSPNNRHQGVALVKC